MPKKKASGSSSSTSVKKSTRIKRDETKNEQITNEETIQEEIFSKNEEETQPNLSLPKKRTKPTSPASKNTRAKKARNEDEQHQTTEEMKIEEVPGKDIQKSHNYKTEASKDTSPIGKVKGKNKAIEKSNDSTVLPSVLEKYNVIDDASATESTSFMSFKSQDTLVAEKSSANTSLSNFSKHDSSAKIDDDDTVPFVREKWDIIKAQLFEVPREPRPAYREYQDKLFVKHPWMKKKDIDYLQKLYTDPKSMLDKKQFKVRI